MPGADQSARRGAERAGAGVARRRPWAAAAAGGLLSGGAIAAACSTPSAGIDGGDLMGVFERDAAADAADAARAKGDGSASKRGDAGVDAGKGAVTRPPTEGSCVAQQGQPGRALRRTLGRPSCRRAQVLEWRDAEGSPRYACVTAPPGVQTRAPLPVILFFHAEGETPASVEKRTGLRKLAATFNLTGDPAHAGFLVLATQGRAFKGEKRADAPRQPPFDVDYTGADNVDVAAVDHFLDELSAKGLVDKARVYALGESYGGRMAATYAMLRADRVAAFATYGSDAPPATWSCPGPPPPAMALYRACDDVAPCDSVERWLRARDALSAETTSLRLGEAAGEEPHCALRNRCSPSKAAMVHARWPKPREKDLLRFFAGHALAVPP